MTLEVLPSGQPPVRLTGTPSLGSTHCDVNQLMALLRAPAASDSVTIQRHVKHEARFS